jgi:hypothetical protein
MAFNPEKHERVLKRTLKKINDGVDDDIKILERRVAELVQTEQPATSLRPQIQQAFAEAKQGIISSSQSVTDISADTLEQSKLPVTPDDQVAAQALAEQTGKTIGGQTDSYFENVMEVVTIGGAAGIGTSLLVNQVRGKISGVFMDSSDREVRRQQKILKKSGATPEEVANATRVIRDRLTGVNTTASLRDLTAKNVQDTVMKFDAAFIAGRAERAGIERFEYAGGESDNTRPFCRDMVDQTLTKDEIYEIWDSEFWAGKEPGDPFIVRGGYNCQHFWVPVED